MADPVINGTRTVLLVCGDDEAVKSTVLRLAADVGFDAVHAGQLINPRFLEPWAML
jgi:predicted dinucleotide-binding enzyme